MEELQSNPEEYAVDSSDIIEKLLEEAPRKGTKAWKDWQKRVNKLIDGHNDRFGTVYSKVKDNVKTK